MNENGPPNGLYNNWEQKCYAKRIFEKKKYLNHSKSSFMKMDTLNVFLNKKSLRFNVYVAISLCSAYICIYCPLHDVSYRPSGTDQHS